MSFENERLSGMFAASSQQDVNVFSLLALSLIPVENVNAGIFSRITMTSMTSKWYLRLTHFEAILVGLVVLQVFVMRYFLILPLDLTKLIDDGTLLATSVSRRKRSSVPEIIQQHRLAESMFSILRRLDEDDCFLKTLCELEADVKISQPVGQSATVLNMLSSLKRLGIKRIKLENQVPQNNVTIIERKVIADFEDAVLLGSGYSTEINSDTCEKTSNPENRCASHYALCGTNKNELLGYVNNIMPFLTS